MGKEKQKESPYFDAFEDAGQNREHFLILHNDEVNSFDFVIESLMDVCDHDHEQAEQCAFITHYKGKCDVRKGVVELLNPMRHQLIEKGLQATID